MEDTTKADVLIVGGSYAGLSAAMALGRALRKVTIIDSGVPCNRQTPHSHNFITQDGQTPAAITAIAREQVLRYPTITILQGKVIQASKNGSQFQVTTEAGEKLIGKKLLLATGVYDIMPAIPGFAECWGISVIHCPYCHGYEYHSQATGIMLNGPMAFEMSKMVSNWTKDLTLFTNGTSTLTEEQAEKLHSINIPVVETPIQAMEHQDGVLQRLRLADGSTHTLAALYAKPAFRQHTDLPEQLGCALNENGFIQVDEFQRTCVPGVFAAGDNTTMFRSVAMATAAGNIAGAVINKEMIDDSMMQ